MPPDEANIFVSVVRLNKMDGIFAEAFLCTKRWFLFDMFIVALLAVGVILLLRLKYVGQKGTNLQDG